MYEEGEKKRRRQVPKYIITCCRPCPIHRREKRVTASQKQNTRHTLSNEKCRDQPHIFLTYDSLGCPPTLICCPETGKEEMGWAISKPHLGEMWRSSRFPATPRHEKMEEVARGGQKKGRTCHTMHGVTTFTEFFPLHQLFCDSVAAERSQVDW